MLDFICRMVLLVSDLKGFLGKKFAKETFIVRSEAPSGRCTERYQLSWLDNAFRGILGEKII